MIAAAVMVAHILPEIIVIIPRRLLLALMLRRLPHYIYIVEKVIEAHLFVSGGVIYLLNAQIITVKIAGHRRLHPCVADNISIDTVIGFRIFIIGMFMRPFAILKLIHGTFQEHSLTVVPAVDGHTGERRRRLDVIARIQTVFYESVHVHLQGGALAHLPGIRVICQSHHGKLAAV